MEGPTASEDKDSAERKFSRYYPWGCVAPVAGGPKLANFGDKSFRIWLQGKMGQIVGHAKHDWCYDDGYINTAPVGSFPEGKSPFGVMDMVGNVDEWCLDTGGEVDDQNSDGQGDALTDPCLGTCSSTDLTAHEVTHVYRGGSWGDAAMHDPEFGRTSPGAVSGADPGHDAHFMSTWLPDSSHGRDDRTGFRVACTCMAGKTCESAAAIQTVTDGEKLEVVKIPKGSFIGSPRRGWPGFGAGTISSIPATGRKVSISKDFWIGKYEVTKGQFREWTKNKTGNYQPHQGDTEGCWIKVREDESDTWAADGWQTRKSRTWETAIPNQPDNHPVVCVTWNDAIEFAKWLGADGDGWTCSLPTAAQWEYAAKGSETPCASAQPENEDSMPNLTAAWPCGSD